MTDLHQDDEYDRRFAGVAKIYGGEAFKHYEKSHVMVIGIGGVGSWAVEALARTGVGELTLVDMDSIAASNINRQLPAMTSTLGHEKIEVMAERCRQINPRIKINLIEDYLSADNIKEILADVPDLIPTGIALSLRDGSDSGRYVSESCNYQSWRGEGTA